jgi:hypothetical protein
MSSLKKALLPFTILILAKASPSDYVRLNYTDITPCVPPCIRVGDCGNYAPNPNGPCNITWLLEQCDLTYGCVAINSNGWLKGCGNETCGAVQEGANVDSYIKNQGIPPPPLPCEVAPVDDEHYPQEEITESNGAIAPSLLSASNSEGWAVLALNGNNNNVTIGNSAFGFILLSISTDSNTVVVEYSFRRWGFISYVSITSGEIARLRKGVGLVPGISSMPNYAYLNDLSCGYYGQVYGNKTDYIGNLILQETNGEADYVTAAKYLPPQRDYASIGPNEPYQKYSVSPDGRIKIADSDIWTTGDNKTETGPGVLVFDPADYIPWPDTNFSIYKSALVGNHLRVIFVAGYDPISKSGFEEVAFSPIEQPGTAAYVRLRAFDVNDFSGPYMYFQANGSINGAYPVLPLDPETFYSALLAEQTFWNTTFLAATQYKLPGQDGARQVDTTRGALVASVSLFIASNPNYGSGADYWSPQIDRGGSLPFQEIAVVQNLLDIGLADLAAKFTGFWFDNYLNPDGSISTGDWEDSCPNKFADGLADIGEMQDLFARVARMQLAANTVNGSAWLSSHFAQGLSLTQYALALRKNATARGEVPGVNVTAGLIYGSPEHDLCHSPDYFYHNNVWFARGLFEFGKLLTEVCPSQSVCSSYASLGATLTNEAQAFVSDIMASLKLSSTFNTTSPDVPYFITPFAKLGQLPYSSMVQDTFSEYANFRFFSEFLGADILPPAWSAALQNFRENTMGTVSGITRWSDHLDDMPSSYYLAASLRDDRIERFLLLTYGHNANYMGRGTLTATEQLPIYPDANGQWRDYLWGYLEGGIDECVPSIMLTAISTRWQLVLERYDETNLYLSKGAPRRWFDPANGGFSITNAATRFGQISMNVSNTATSSGETSLASVAFKTWEGQVFGAPLSLIVIRLRSSQVSQTMDSSSVIVTGGATLSTVDSATNLITVQPSTGSTTFTVSAKFS